VQAVAGEDLAVACGLADPVLADLEGLGPLVDPRDVVVVGVRPQDEDLAEVRGLGAHVLDSVEVTARGATAVAADVLRHLEERAVNRFWIHVDADVLDPQVLPAVDSPAPGGPSPATVAAVLRVLAAAPAAAGLELTVFDPDLDPGGEQAELLAGILVNALGGLPPAGG